MASLRLFAIWALTALSTPVACLPTTEQHVLGAGHDDKLDHVHKVLKKAEIIPTVIDDFMPTLSLSVHWSSKCSASLGNTLKPSKLQAAPSVTLHDPSSSSSLCSQPNMTYTIALTDPDAPSRDDPKWSEVCHWIATGLSALASSTGKCELSMEGDDHDLDEIMEYEPPGPPEKTGKHRYVFLAFAPENGTTDKLHLSKPSDRKHWGYGEVHGEKDGVKDWAKDNGLVPVAANFIYAQHKKQ